MSVILVAVSWNISPFNITHAYIGNKEEICAEAKRVKDNIFKHREKQFVACLDRVMSGYAIGDYQDNNYGFFVTTTHEFSTKESAIRFVGIAYGKLIISY